MKDARGPSRRLAVLLGCEQVTMADFDRQRLWVELGPASVLCYLHRDLKLSKVVAPFREGKLCIATMVDLAKVSTPENSADVLPWFRGRK